MKLLRSVTLVILGTIILGFGMAHHSTAGIIEEDGDIFLIDRTGERWEITQAVSIGFKPEKFEFGIGRNTIRPLDDTNLEKSFNFADAGARVIGVENGAEAHAYVVLKLVRHEIANTRLGDTPIAAAYWPLVDLAAVYSRQIDKRTVTLAASGWTYDRTFVLYDKETGTLWYPYERGLMGIQGHYFQKWLPRIDSHDTQWKKWIDRYPDTELLRWLLSVTTPINISLPDTLWVPTRNDSPPE